MTTSESPTSLPTQSLTPAASSAASPVESRDNLNPSVDIISQMVVPGLAKSFDALKEKFTETIAENGEHYVDQMKDSAGKLVQWSKKNPVKTVVAVAAVLAVSVFLISTMKNKAAAATTKTDKETPPLTPCAENPEAPVATEQCASTSA